MLDAIVVGAGLFGSIITAKLRSEGREVMLLDGEAGFAGSGPAACLMKPSWFSSLGKDVYEPALRVLDDLYVVEEVEFQLRAAKGLNVKRGSVNWVPHAKILEPGRYKRAWITRVAPGRVHTQRECYEAPLVVVAAGIWTEELLPQFKQQAQKGIAFLYRNSSIALPFIQPWAPYKQLVAFNRGDGLWVGDGTAIKAENWTTEREEHSLQRCRDAVGNRMNEEPEMLIGIRPYAKGHKPCLLEEVQPGLWVASGGAKNGTLAAGYCAYVISRST